MPSISGSRGSLSRLEAVMLDDSWHPTNSICDVYEYMDEFKDDETVYDESNNSYNGSFAAQMHAIRRIVSEQNNIKDPKIAYFLTYKSALPIAKAIHGYYDALGIERPPLDYIKSYARPREYKGLSIHTLVRQETSRVQRQIKQHKPVAVVTVDQFVASGYTMQLANDTLHRAGIVRDQIYPIGGRWYHDYYPEDRPPTEILTIDEASDPLAAKFYMIGNLAAKQQLNVA